MTPPLNDLSILWYTPSRARDRVDAAVALATKSPYTHTALRLGDWSLHIGGALRSTWLYQPEWDKQWTPCLECRIGSFHRHALDPGLVQYEGRRLSRSLMLPWAVLGLYYGLWLPEPETCVRLTKEVLFREFNIRMSGRTPQELLNEARLFGQVATY
jgi:hypothetical protein